MQDMMFIRSNWAASAASSFCIELVAVMTMCRYQTLNTCDRKWESYNKTETRD
jgi:hypothetical protein